MGIPASGFRAKHLKHFLGVEPGFRVQRLSQGLVSRLWGLGAAPEAGAMSTMLLERAAQGTRSPDQPTATERSPTCRLLPRSLLLNSLTCHTQPMRGTACSSDRKGT